jgi:uncharacterized coiled-coil protein SlyX
MSAPSLSSLLRSKHPLSHLPEFAALKSDVGALQRRAGKCEACERRVEASERQREADAVAVERKMRALGDAFRVLSDVVVSELESLRADVTAQRNDLDVVRAQMRWTHGAEAEARELRAFVHEKVVREGARRERRDAEITRRVETVEKANARRERDEADAADAAEASVAYRTACDARLAILERRAVATEEAITRVSRNVAAHAEALLSEPRRSEGDRAARAPVAARMALGGGDGATGHRVGRRLSDRSDDPVDAGPRGLALETCGLETVSRRSSFRIGSGTAASLMSPAAERFMRDDASE